MKAIPWVLALMAAAGVFGWCAAYNRFEQEKGAWGVRDSIRTVRLDSLGRDSKVRAAKYDRDTSVLWRRVRGAPRLERDTLWLEGDSVPYPVDRPVPGPVVREVVRENAATLLACTNALSTCEGEKATLRSRITELEAAREDPKPAEPWWRRRVALTAGYGAVRTPDGTITSGWGVAFGIRVFPW
jgi:hypothetical protein